VIRRPAALAAAIVVALGAAAASAAPPRHSGRITVFAHIAAPGEPALTLVTPQHRVFVGTFTDLVGSDTSPSRVYEYSDHGRLLRTFVIRGETPKAAHGVQVAARDRRGRLYLLDQKPARVVVLNPRTGAQHSYATFADVPTCASVHRTTSCSNAILDSAPEPDYAAWLPDGSLVVTDYAQQLLWRVPPHGGRARVWLNAAQLDGELFGPAGIVLMPGHHSLLMSVATGGITSLDPTDSSVRGRLDRVVLGRHDRVRRIVTLWSSLAAEAPDGFAVSRDDRHIYLALAGPLANSVVELVRSGGAWRRVGSFPGGLPSPVPWDTATSVQFLGHRILVTNQSYFTSVASHWVVFAVTVPQRGMPAFVPRHAGLR
jgi:hypothetical protein